MSFSTRILEAHKHEVHNNEPLLPILIIICLVCLFVCFLVCLFFKLHGLCPELAQIHVHRVSDGIQPFILSCPPLLLPSIFPSIRLFSNELGLHLRWPKYWSLSLSFSISLSSEYSGLISFRIDWLDLLAVQETLKSLLQHHSSKASIFLKVIEESKKAGLKFNIQKLRSWHHPILLLHDK